VIGTVVLHTGNGEDVVIVTDPLPEADELELKVPFTVKSVLTGGPGDVLVIVKLPPVIARGGVKVIKFAP
jgi:hypothetical protein